jgi:hypothetical protein
VVVVEEEEELNKKVSKPNQIKNKKNERLTLYSCNRGWLIVDGVRWQSLEDGINAILEMLKAHVECIHLLLNRVVAQGDSLKCTITPCCKLMYLLCTS